MKIVLTVEEEAKAKDLNVAWMQKWLNAHGAYPALVVDGDTVKVTQAKYNQTAEIKNGKVQTVKKLSESQTEAEFK